jgi:hypothetical protein
MLPLNQNGLVSNRPGLDITHAVTCDGPDGRQLPPPDDAALWAVVRRANGVTYWRSIQILPSDPPPADAHLGLGGMNRKVQPPCRLKLIGSPRSTSTPKA